MIWKVDGTSIATRSSLCYILVGCQIGAQDFLETQTTLKAFWHCLVSLSHIPARAAARRPNGPGIHHAT
jgi:hypothetical protein